MKLIIKYIVLFETVPNFLKMALRVPTGQTVEVRFTSVSFGTQETCDSDFIEIFDVAGANAGGGTTVTTRFCGNVRSFIQGDTSCLSNLLLTLI